MQSYKFFEICCANRSLLSSLHSSSPRGRRPRASGSSVPVRSTSVLAVPSGVTTGLSVSSSGARKTYLTVANTAVDKKSRDNSVTTRRSGRDFFSAWRDTVLSVIVENRGILPLYSLCQQTTRGKKSLRGRRKRKTCRPCGV